MVGLWIYALSYSFPFSCLVSVGANAIIRWLACITQVPTGRETMGLLFTRPIALSCGFPTKLMHAGFSFLSVLSPISECEAAVGQNVRTLHGIHGSVPE